MDFGQLVEMSSDTTITKSGSTRRATGSPSGASGRGEVKRVIDFTPNLNNSTPVQIYRSQHFLRLGRNGSRKGNANAAWEEEAREGRPDHAETAVRRRRIRRDRPLQVSPDAPLDPNWNRVASKEDSLSFAGIVPQEQDKCTWQMNDQGRERSRKYGSVCHSS